MRIISGSRKGRRIEPPRDIIARPTTDVAKESLFDILAGYVDFTDITVLDLFSGTGSISYEFASRGASSVTSVESNRMQANFIRRTAQELDFQSMQVVCADVFRFLKRNAGVRYDVVFADPPYALPTLESLPDLVVSAGLLSDHGIFVLEHSKSNDFSHRPDFLRHRKYGSVNFSFFTPNANL